MLNTFDKSGNNLNKRGRNFMITNNIRRKNNSVKSSMIWGSQYDAMINWAKQGEDKA